LPNDVQHLGQFVAGPLDDEGIAPFLEEDAEALDLLLLEAASDALLPPVVAIGGLEFSDDEGYIFPTPATTTLAQR